MAERVIGGGGGGVPEARSILFSSTEQPAALPAWIFLAALL